MIYLDNAATSYPKPPEVTKAMHDYMVDVGVSINRGVYPEATEAGGVVYETRERLAALFGITDPDRVVFTHNVTAALNTVLLGFLKPGDHVIVSSMEHNAVMRPLVHLGEKDVTFSRAQCDEEGRLDPERVRELIRPETVVVVMTHASNVSGTILPLADVGAIAHEHGLRFIVDAAQTAGVIPVRADELQADAICFTGHKSLYGPQGTGGIVFANGFEVDVEPLILGGTGSASDHEVQPDYMPDRFESGTPNMPGIVGLHAALGFLEDTGIETIRAHELATMEHILSRVEPLVSSGTMRIAGPADATSRTGVISLFMPGVDMATLAHHAAREIGVAVRCGLHCAPSAHRTLGTFPEGTFRIGLGYHTLIQDVDILLDWLADNL